MIFLFNMLINARPQGTLLPLIKNLFGIKKFDLHVRIYFRSYWKLVNMCKDTSEITYEDGSKIYQWTPNTKWK